MGIVKTRCVTIMQVDGGRYTLILKTLENNFRFVLNTFPTVKTVIQ